MRDGRRQKLFMVPPAELLAFYRGVARVGSNPIPADATCPYGYWSPEHGAFVMVVESQEYPLVEWDLPIPLSLNRPEVLMESKP